MYLLLIAVGRLGSDPVMRYMPNGDPVTSFNIATDRQWTDRNGQRQKETTWLRISVFGKQAESCNTFLSKGKMVLVEGRLRPDAKTGGPEIYTRQDGSAGANFDVIASTVKFLSPRSEGDSNPASEDEPAF